MRRRRKGREEKQIAGESKSWVSCVPGELSSWIVGRL